MSGSADGIPLVSSHLHSFLHDPFYRNLSAEQIAPLEEAVTRAVHINFNLLQEGYFFLWCSSSCRLAQNAGLQLD